MSERICSIEGCSNKVRARGWCDKHYRRWKRNGDPMVKRRVRGTCTVEDCPNEHRARGWCYKHYQRWLHHGDLTADLRRKDVVKYGWAHGRVRAARGDAPEHSCVECGQPADEWSYDHTDPEPLFNERGRPYSLDVQRYQARCHSCHTRFDKGR